jgi:hypothetical protein
LPDESEENNKTLNPNPLYDSENSYVLQEQFSEYLGVKSFKRKYPDIFRRLTEVEERRYLKDNKIVTETQCDLGIYLNQLLNPNLKHFVSLKERYY